MPGGPAPRAPSQFTTSADGGRGQRDRAGTRPSTRALCSPAPRGRPQGCFLPCWGTPAVPPKCNGGSRGGVCPPAPPLPAVPPSPSLQARPLQGPPLMTSSNPGDLPKAPLGVRLRRGSLGDPRVLSAAEGSLHFQWERWMNQQANDTGHKLRPWWLRRAQSRGWFPLPTTPSHADSLLNAPSGPHRQDPRPPAPSPDSRYTCTVQGHHGRADRRASRAWSRHGAVLARTAEPGAGARLEGGPGVGAWQEGELPCPRLTRFGRAAGFCVGRRHAGVGPAATRSAACAHTPRNRAPAAPSCGSQSFPGTPTSCA